MGLGYKGGWPGHVEGSLETAASAHALTHPAGLACQQGMCDCGVVPGGLGHVRPAPPNELPQTWFGGGQVGGFVLLVLPRTYHTHGD